MGPTAAVSVINNDFLRAALEQHPDLTVDCGICLGKIRLADVESWTSACKAGHIFHRECLQKWWTATRPTTCPTCREPATMEALAETDLSRPAAQGAPSHSPPPMGFVRRARGGPLSEHRGPTGPADPFRTSTFDIPAYGLRLHSDANRQDHAGETNRHWSVPERRGLADPGRERDRREPREPQNEPYEPSRYHAPLVRERRGLAAQGPPRQREEREAPDEGPPVYRSIGPPPDEGPYQSLTVPANPELNLQTFQYQAPPPPEDGIPVYQQGVHPSYYAPPPPEGEEDSGLDEEEYTHAILMRLPRQ